MGALRNRIRTGLESPQMPFIAAAIGILLCLPALGMGFFADDWMQRATFLQPPDLAGLYGEPFADFFTFADGDPERMHALVDRGIFPWISHGEIRFRFWRPVTVATHWLDYRLWPNSPVMMHVHNLAWYGALIVVVGLFYRRMMGPGLATGLATLLFAVDDAHAWPAAWIANRNALVALLLCVAVLYLHTRWRQDRIRWAAAVSVAIYAVALLAKESSISACGYLFAYALFLDRGTLRSRIASLIPYGVVTVVWRVFYLRAGYGAAGSLGYIDPLGDPGAFIGALVTRGPVMLVGQFALPPSDLYTFAPPQLQPFMVGWGLFVIVVLGIVLAPTLRQDSVARFWCLGALLAIVPIVAAGPQDRLLMFPGLGAMGLLARFFAAYASGALTPSRILKPVAYSLIGIHFVFAPLNLPGAIVALDYMNGVMMRVGEEGVPKDPGIEEKTVIFANTTNYPGATYLYIGRGLEGAPAPAHVRDFGAPTMSALPIRLERTDAHTIVAEPEPGYAWSLFRSDEHPLLEGEVVTLSGVEIEILSLDRTGCPRQVAYRFEHSLDAPRYLWRYTKGFDVLPMEPLKVGERVTIDPLGGIQPDSMQTH